MNQERFEKSERIVRNEVHACVSNMMDDLLKMGEGYQETNDWQEWLDEAVSKSWHSAGEVFEYWLISDWLGEKLTARGHVVMDTSQGKVWGRQTTGQGIALDLMQMDFENNRDLPDEIVNPEDKWCWETCWQITVTNQGFVFLVWAESEQDAIDTLIDWIDDHDDYDGLLIREPDEDDGEDETWLGDCAIQGGNYGYYLSTDGVCQIAEY